jgi:hypothetical protein
VALAQSTASRATHEIGTRRQSEDRKSSGFEHSGVVPFASDEVIECSGAMSPTGTSRQFAAQQEFGSNWRQSGHATTIAPKKIVRNADISVIDRPLLDRTAALAAGMQLKGNSSRTSIAAWQLMAHALQRPARFRTFQVYPKDPRGQPVAG